jgi:hypothetical protein
VRGNHFDPSNFEVRRDLDLIASLSMTLNRRAVRVPVKKLTDR